MTQFDRPLSAVPSGRSAGGRLLAALTGLAAFLVMPGGLLAVETPLPTKHTVDGDFYRAYSVFAADIDGDGDQDILGVSKLGSDIAWWENTTGDGTAWTEHVVEAEAGWVEWVFATDVDGDGDTDVLGNGDYPTDTLSWWENTTGDGTAWIQHSVARICVHGLCQPGCSVFAADIDGDGDADVVSGESRSDKVYWWENTTGPGGTSWIEHTVADFYGPKFVVAADVDGDGDLDVIASNSGAASGTRIDVNWWENTTGDGSTWVDHTIDDIRNPYGQQFPVFAADIDGDGDTDVVGALWNAGYLFWYENTTGDGSAWSRHNVHSVLSKVVSVFVADVDGDGDTDLLAAAGCLFLQEGDEQWCPVEVPGASATLVDTRTDIAWWENTIGDGSSWTYHPVDEQFGEARSVFAADVDGDGDMDVLGASRAADEIAWWENKTIHRSALYGVAHTVDAEFDGAISAHGADMDGDGDLDVLGAANLADDVSWWENIAGDGTAWSEHTIDGDFDAAIAAYPADLDGDGDLDALGAAFDADDITWWENTAGNGTAWSEHTVDGDFDAARSVHAADVDGDGDLDVLGAAVEADDITWWENTAGDGSGWSEHTVDGDFNAAFSVHAADLDGDGDLDVLGAAASDDDITWWENTAGDGTAWSEHTVDGDFDGARSVYAADVDGDGDLDVLGAAFDADDITWWENTAGNGTAWSEHTVEGDLDGARFVHAADVDGDGDPDILGSAFDADDITWWENTAGNGTAWSEHTVEGDFDAARFVHAADIDGDGDLDLVGSDFDADDIMWWENRGGQFALPTANTASPILAGGTLDDLLAIESTHRGRTGDTDLELTSFELLLEAHPGDPLTTSEANNLIESLRIYLDDDDSGDFNPADPMVTSVDTLALDAAGIQQVELVDSSPDVRVAFGTARRYHVVVELTPNAATQDPNQLRLTHITESSSTAEDADHDLPLALELSTNVASSIWATEEACPDFVTIDQGTVTGGARAGVQITAGPNLTIDGTLQSVRFVAGAQMIFDDDTAISGEFTAEVSATPCP